MFSDIPCSLVHVDRPAVGSATKRSWHDVEAPGAASNVPDLPRRILFSAAALRASTASLSFKDVTKWVKVDVSGISKDASCCICLCSFEESDVDEPCIRFGSCTGHYFHLSCVNTGSFFRNGFVKCPVCTNIYGKVFPTALWSASTHRNPWPRPSLGANPLFVDASSALY